MWAAWVLLLFQQKIDVKANSVHKDNKAYIERPRFNFSLGMIIVSWTVGFDQEQYVRTEMTFSLASSSAGTGKAHTVERAIKRIAMKENRILLQDQPG